MSINRVEINDFLVFKDSFTADFCNGINVSQRLSQTWLALEIVKKRIT